MRLRPLATTILATLLLSLGLLAPAEATAARAIAGTITLTVNCAASPETTSIANNTDQALDLTTFTLTSIDQPRPNEPFRLSGTLAVGGTASFQSGAGAAGTVLTGQNIYDNEAANEGARLVTPFGTLTVLCSARTGTLNVGGATTTTTTTAPVQQAPPPPPTTTTTARTMTTTAAATATTARTTTTTTTTTTALPSLPNTGAGGGADPLAQGAGVVALLGALALGGAAALRRRRAA